jgi:DNA-binding NarL/FixJ family response regulator
MTRASSRERSDVLFEEVELRIACIASSESAASVATSALEHDGLRIDSRYLGSGLAAAGLIDAGIDVILIVDDASEPQAVVRAARVRAPDAGIVVVAPLTTQRETRALLAAGADSVVVDTERQEVLPAAVRCAALGQISIPRPLRDALEPLPLTPAELQIVALAAAGCTNAQIADRLCIAESTVKARFSALFRRLGVSSRRQAAAAVLASDDEFHRRVLASVAPTPPARGGHLPPG